MAKKPKYKKLKTFIVDVQEVHIQEIKIQARDKEDALERVKEGEGEEVCPTRYSYTLDNCEDWTVVQQKEK